MDNPIIDPHAGNGNKPIQIGPPWTCFECGAPARLACYTDFHNPRAIPKPLDRWAAHIWYLLDLPCSHPPRVARLGDAISPLIFPYDNSSSRRTQQEQAANEHEAIRLIREALARIAALHSPNPQADPAAAIVWNLVAGAITPEGAILEIREMVQSAISKATLAALDAQPEPEFAFSEAAR